MFEEYSRIEAYVAFIQKHTPNLFILSLLTGSTGSQGSVPSFAGTMLPGHAVCHAETAEVVLVSDRNGFGLSLGSTGYPEDVMTDPPFISFIEPKSVAER